MNTNPGETTVDGADFTECVRQNQQVTTIGSEDGRIDTDAIDARCVTRDTQPLTDKM
jgi:hypothetical protein